MKIGLFIDRWKCLFPIGLSWILIVFGIFGQARTVPFFVNSDTLQPAFMAWDMTRHAYAIPNFQWSRVPSLPDQAFFFLMEWLSVGWRTSFLLYTCIAAAAASLALGAVVARLRGTRFGDGVFWAGIAVTLTLLSIMAVIAFVAGSPAEIGLRIPQAILFLCNSHGDAFLISIVTCCTALGALRGNRKLAWITWALCVLATASDTMFVGYFPVPFSLALALVWVRRRRAGAALPALKASLRFLAVVAVACLAGWIAKFPLPMQAMRLEFPGIDVAIGRVSRDLPQMPWVAALLALTLVLSLRAAWDWCKPAGDTPVDEAAVDREVLILTGLGASLMGLGLAVLLYLDSGTLRYALPMFWWPLAIVLGFIGLRSSWKLSAGVFAGVAAATLAMPLSASVLPNWHTPLEKCLSDNRSAWGLKAGLATYWHSRITMVSSDWALQVDQIHDTGDAYLWGNNIVSYKYDMHAPERPPEYNFIVLDETSSPFDLETNFGTAPRVEACGDFQVWIYDQPIVPPGIDYRPPKSVGFEFIPK